VRAHHAPRRVPQPPHDADVPTATEAARRWLTALLESGERACGQEVVRAVLKVDQRRRQEVKSSAAVVAESEP
jgi:hypothetical protein